MQQQRDLNRTRERIMAAALKEFAANGFAGARTDAIARRAHVNERMIFYCFESKEGLYRAVLETKVVGQSSNDRIDAGRGLRRAAWSGDLTSVVTISTRFGCGSGRRSTRVTANWSRKRSGEPSCSPRLLAGGERKPAEAYLPTPTKRCCCSSAAALRVFPLILPQVVSLVTGMDPLDPEFRRRWTASLECIGRRLFSPDIKAATRSRSERRTVRSRSENSLRLARQPAAAGIKGHNFTAISDRR